MAAYTLSPDGSAILATGAMDWESLSDLAMEAALHEVRVEMIDPTVQAVEEVSAVLEGYGRLPRWFPIAARRWVCEHRRAD
jgi:hypothetical protein